MSCSIPIQTSLYHSIFTTIINHYSISPVLPHLYFYSTRQANFSHLSLLFLVLYHTLKPVRRPSLIYHAHPLSQLQPTTSNHAQESSTQLQFTMIPPIFYIRWCLYSHWREMGFGIVDLYLNTKSCAVRCVNTSSNLHLHPQET